MGVAAVPLLGRAAVPCLVVLLRLPPRLMPAMPGEWQPVSSRSTPVGTFVSHLWASEDDAARESVLVAAVIRAGPSTWKNDPCRCCS